MHKAAGQSPCAEVREIVRTRLAELDARLAELKRYRREFARALSEWDEVGEVEGHVCGLVEGTTIAGPSDVGIAIGTGTDVAIEASDVTLV